MHAQWRHLRQFREVAINVQEHRIVADCTRGDQTIDAGANGQSRPSRVEKEVNGFVKDDPGERLFEHWNIVERRLRNSSYGEVVEALQDLLDHREACHDLAIR